MYSSNLFYSDFSQEAIGEISKIMMHILVNIDIQLYERMCEGVPITPWRAMGTPSHVGLYNNIKIKGESLPLGKGRGCPADTFAQQKRRPRRQPRPKVAEGRMRFENNFVKNFKKFLTF